MWTEFGAALKLGAAPLDPPFGMAARHVRAADHAVDGGRQHVTALCENDLGGVGVADAVIEPSGQVTQRCDRIQGRKPWVVGDPGGFNEFFGPAARLIIFGYQAE